MAKAVLVMDMPEDCKQCVFCRGLNACKLKKYLVRDKICTVYTVDKQIMEGGKPDWCPLRELPERSDHPDHCDNGRFDAGWNGCLDAIEGGAHGKEQSE
jgi:hypothetical protein